MQTLEQMENSEKLVTELVKNGAATITILEGTAPDHVRPKAVVIAGTINAPRLFMTARISEIEILKTHALVNRKEGSIVLLIDEKNAIDHTKITGRIEMGKIFADLGINSEKAYTTQSLSKKLRMMRSVFVSKDDHASVVSSLKNLIAKVQREIEKTDDTRGGKSDIFRQTVESNVPQSFMLKMPLIEGSEAESFEVSIMLEVGDSNNVICKLESVDAAEQQDAELERLVNEEAKYLEDQKVAVIYC